MVCALDMRTSSASNDELKAEREREEGESVLRWPQAPAKTYLERWRLSPRSPLPAQRLRATVWPTPEFWSSWGASPA